MINQKQLDVYCQRAKDIKRKNATNDDEWYETIHQYYPELVEELLTKLQKTVSKGSYAADVMV
jgi:hypothetical protein